MYIYTIYIGIDELHSYTVITFLRSLISQLQMSVSILFQLR